jgi:hypothetical protein
MDYITQALGWIALQVSFDALLELTTWTSSALFVLILLASTKRGRQLLIAVDQALNVVFGSGYADETLSSYFHRRADWRERAVNLLFWWQKDAHGKRNHCERAWMSEQQRRHQPPELRDLTNLMEKST